MIPTNPKPLVMWVIYDHPSDFPDEYVARKWINKRPTEITLVKKDLQELRILLALNYMGMKCFPRKTLDDPVIVEMWM